MNGMNKLPAAKTVDEYLERLPADQRTALEKLRKTIRAAAPKAQEVISYQIPVYKYHGALVCFGAFPDHCSLYVVNKNLLNVFAKELEGYKTTGTTIHFTPDKPLPTTLVKKIVKARIADNEGRVMAKKK